MRLEEKCEMSPLRVASWYHLLTLIVSGLKPALSSASVSRSGFITSSSNSTLGEKKGKALRKMVAATMHMYNVIIFANEQMRESASADVIFVASWFSESMVVLTNITWNGPSREACEREIFKASRKKTFSPPLRAWMFYTMYTRSPCAPWVSWNLDARQLLMISLFSLLWSSCLPSPMICQQSAKQFWVEMWARSWLLPEQASFRNMEIMWIVSFLLR